MPAAVPAPVMTRPSSTKSTDGSTVAVGNRAASSSACIQCVVQRRPSRRPASPSANAPLQMLSTQAPRSCASRSARRTSSPTRPGPPYAGTTTRSTSRVASSPCSTSNEKPAFVGTGTPGVGPHTRKSNDGPPVSDRSMPNTSQAVPSSKGAALGRARTATERST